MCFFFLELFFGALLARKSGGKWVSQLELVGVAWILPVFCVFGFEQGVTCANATPSQNSYRVLGRPLLFGFNFPCGF